MPISTENQNYVLKKDEMIKTDMLMTDMLMTATLAAFWAASSEFNSALQIPTNTQNLEDITGAIGGDDHAKELDELLQGLDVLTSIGGDAISSIVAALVGTGLYAGYQYKYAMHNSTSLTLVSKTVLGMMLGKSVAYIGAKEITAQIAMHTITAANPLLHIPMSITFALVYGLFSTLFTEYAMYKVMKPLKEKTNKMMSYTFSDHLKGRNNLLKDFCCNVMTGLALYGSTLIPGLSTVESVATTVAITSATAVGTRAAWTIATASKSSPDNESTSYNQSKNSYNIIIN
jgi:hypothetical protein